jgi:hypothetical protein
VDWLTHDVCGVGKRGGGAFNVSARDIVRNRENNLAKSWQQGKRSLCSVSVDSCGDEKEDDGH